MIFFGKNLIGKYQIPGASPPFRRPWLWRHTQKNQIQIFPIFLNQTRRLSASLEGLNSSGSIGQKVMTAQSQSPHSGFAVMKGRQFLLFPICKQTFHY